MRRNPIERRKADLARLLAPTRPGLRLNDWLDDIDRATIFEHACKLGLEGIVSKRKGSRYRSGRSEHFGIQSPRNTEKRRCALRTAGAYYDGTLGQFILPYDAVRRAPGVRMFLYRELENLLVAHRPVMRKVADNGQLFAARLKQRSLRCQLLYAHSDPSQFGPT